jgi:hypothetical protein
MVYISQVYCIVRPNYAVFYVGESFILRSILEDIIDNDIGFHGGKDTLSVLMHDRGFKFGKFDSR